MGKFIIWCSAALLLVASLAAVTQGLQCYACFDATGVSDLDGLVGLNPLPFVEWKGHKSCVDGKIPDGSLKETCRDDIKKGDKAIPPVCAQFKGTIAQYPQIGNVIARGCLHADTDVDDLATKEGCHTKTLEEMRSMTEGPLKQLLGMEFQNPTNATGQKQGQTVTTCVCNGDNCNPASTLGSAGLLSLLGVMAILKLVFH